MTSREIRKQFLDFFASKGHKIVASAPIVVKDDPTLLFTNAGMNQFKDYFLGNKKPEFTRIADTQKCLRVSGKHNDLEEVGIDTYHHTMFEMLGNWSFGDYFKEEAIAWSWELLTEVYKLDKSRLYVTIFEGDAAEGLPKDEEALEMWSKWIDKNRILEFNKKDNFWEMGDTGPCGPCTEIHVDLRSDEERKLVDGSTLVNHDHPQVIEIWNNVFIQYNRKKDNSLEALPERHVDTGMGFERLVRCILNKQSNYDTDIFLDLITVLCTQNHYTYGKDEKTDIACRVIVDHLRAICFSIADGQLPSNNGAGYVIRRILRRAVRYGYTYLNQDQPFIYKLIPTLVEQFDGVFPELKTQLTFVSKVVYEEEHSFLRTLGTGIKKFNALEEEGDIKNNLITGLQAFELYDTYGFPIDLTRLMASEKSIQIDEKGFEEELTKQKERSRKAAEMDQGDWIELQPNNLTEFLGYDLLSAEIRITKYRKVSFKERELFHLVFDKTPFYAEGGGQVGDSGSIESANEKVFIKDTKKENELIIHYVDKLPENMSSVFVANVDVTKRKDTQRNHSATHLLHEALRTVLGTHVEQRGSLVNSEYLRFDFSHFQKITKEELSSIEQIVNNHIQQNFTLLERRNTPISEAKNLGAMALFGEKYGDHVRVIQFGSSVELCGGTHVQATGEIGSFKVIAESSVAAGIRRIEAITANHVLSYFNSQEVLLGELGEMLGNAKDLKSSLLTMKEENLKLKKQIETIDIEKSQLIKSTLLSKMESINGVHFIGEMIDLNNGEQIKNLCFQLKNEVPNLVMVLGTVINEKAMVSIVVNEKLVEEKGYSATHLIKEISVLIKGGGGGQAFYATAGGTNVNGIQDALVRVKSLIL
jgi:alanyl-tRNA synthetase